MIYSNPRKQKVVRKMCLMIKSVGPDFMMNTKTIHVQVMNTETTVTITQFTKGIPAV